jgi:hypothetical protein
LLKLFADRHLKEIKDTKKVTRWELNSRYRKKEMGILVKEDKRR